MTREEQIRKAADDYCGDDAREQSPCFYAHIHNAFLEGAAWADSHHNWIPVDKELPKEKQKVSAYFSPNEECEHEYACMALYNYGFHHWEDAEDSGIILEGVTHWMEIQPPRKEDKK